MIEIIAISIIGIIFGVFIDFILFRIWHYYAHKPKPKVDIKPYDKNKEYGVAWEKEYHKKRGKENGKQKRFSN